MGLFGPFQVKCAKGQIAEHHTLVYGLPLRANAFLIPPQQRAGRRAPLLQRLVWQLVSAFKNQNLKLQWPIDELTLSRSMTAMAQHKMAASVALVLQISIIISFGPSSSFSTTIFISRRSARLNTSLVKSTECTLSCGDEGC